MTAFAHLCTVTASTKKLPPVSGGKRGDPIPSLSGLKCLPLDPVDSRTARRLELPSIIELKQTFTQGTLATTYIESGHLFIDAGTGIEYAVRHVEEWMWSETIQTLRIIIEEVKQ